MYVMNLFNFSTIRCDRAIILKDGKIEAQGKLDELLNGCLEMQKIGEN